MIQPGFEAAINLALNNHSFTRSTEAAAARPDSTLRYRSATLQAVVRRSSAHRGIKCRCKWRASSPKAMAYPITTADVPYQGGSPLHNNTPFTCFGLIEIDRPRTMTADVEQAPPCQWCRLWMMTQQPTVIPPDLIKSEPGSIGMERADRTGCITMLISHRKPQQC